jgi:hypothetical protein
MGVEEPGDVIDEDRDQGESAPEIHGIGLARHRPSSGADRSGEPRAIVQVVASTVKPRRIKARPQRCT